MTQVGVEVVPETFKHHQLEEQREKAISISLAQQTGDTSQLPLTDIHQATEGLAHLNLNCQSDQERASRSHHESPPIHEPLIRTFADQPASGSSLDPLPVSSKVCLSASQA